MNKSKAFTLIESMAVIAIIGILATLTTVSMLRAQKNARDGKRRADLYAISQAFEARKLDRTCSDASQIGLYPNASDINGNRATSTWVDVKKLNNFVDCNPFSQYLPTIPSGPRSNDIYDYSLTPDRKHFRIRTSLENVTQTVSSECLRQERIWGLLNPVTEIGCTKSPDKEFFVTGN